MTRGGKQSSGNRKDECSTSSLTWLQYSIGSIEHIASELLVTMPPALRVAERQQIENWILMHPCFRFHSREDVNMKMVMSILRSGCLDRLVKELERIEIRDLTINTIEGTGEEVTVFRNYAVHKMIRIIVPEDKADKIVEVILSVARTGMAGDGIIAVYPIDYMVKIRTMEKFV